jgi:hypothetical protein
MVGLKSVPLMDFLFTQACVAADSEGNEDEQKDPDQRREHKKMLDPETRSPDPRQQRLQL